IDKSSGDTIETRFNISRDTSIYKVSFLQRDPLRVLANGHYVISGMCYGYYKSPDDGNVPLYQASVAEFDANFNFIRDYCFIDNVEGNGNNTKVSIFPDGSGIFSMLHVISGYSADEYSVQFKNGQILKQRR